MLTPDAYPDAFTVLKIFLPIFAYSLTLLHSEWPKLYGVLAFLSAIELITYTILNLLLPRKLLDFLKNAILPLFISFVLTQCWNSLTKSNLSCGHKCTQPLTSLSTDQSMHIQHYPKRQCRMMSTALYIFHAKSKLELTGV